MVNSKQLQNHKKILFSAFFEFLRAVWPKTGTPWAYIHNKPQPNRGFWVKKEPPVGGKPGRQPRQPGFRHKPTKPDLGPSSHPSAHRHPEADLL